MRYFIILQFYFFIIFKSISQDIVTVAGSYPKLGDNGLAINASLKSPNGVCLDASGNVFLADIINNSVRKIDLSGVITTIAGIGTAGYSGDNGPAILAELNFPSSMFIDGVGNLYIADQKNHSIRKIDTGGIITTIAGGSFGFDGDGGLATSAKLSNPTGVAVDNNDIFIVDSGNARIRRVSKITGIISTICGTSLSGYNGDDILAVNAQLNMPYGIAIDALSNIFIADQLNNRIRKINSSTGIITTVAGSGLVGFAGDNASAILARLNSPSDVTVDATGNLYISDRVNNRVRRVDATTGKITSIAGKRFNTGYSGDNVLATDAILSNPIDIALSAEGLILVDQGNNRVRKIDFFSGIISTIAGNGYYNGDNILSTESLINTPYSISLDTKGNIYIAETENHRIRKVDSSTGIITTIAGNGTSGFSGDNELAVNAQLEKPTYVKVDAEGNVYISDSRNFSVRRVDAVTGIISTIAGDGTAGFAGDNGPATSAKLRSIRALEIDISGNLLIADAGNNRIRKVNKQGVISTLIGNGNAGFGGDGGLAVDSQLNFPTGICTDMFGNIFIADFSNSRVRKVDLLGVISTISGDGTFGFNGDNLSGVSAQLNSPHDVFVDNLGNIFLSDSFNNRIRKIDINTGIITTVAGDGTKGFSGDNGLATKAQLNSPYGIALNISGDLLISDTFNNRIRKLPNKKDQVVTGDLAKPYIESMLVYPIPSKNEITIQLFGFEESYFTKITIYDVMGREIENSYKFIKENIVVPISNFASGKYVIRAEQGKKILSAYFFKD